MNITINTGFKEWHIEGLPILGRKVWALIDEDTLSDTQPFIVQASVRYMEGSNPEYLWDILEEDGSMSSYRIAGGESVIAWRYMYRQ